MGIPPGWSFKKASYGSSLYISPYEERFYYNPLEVIVKNEIHAERLSMARVDVPHSCDYCDKVIIDCRTFSIKALLPRPSKASP